MTRSGHGRIGAVSMLTIGSGFLWLLIATGPAGDTLDSPLFWWGWLALPAAAFCLGASVGRTSGTLWPAAGVVPLAVDALFEGFLFYDESEGASFWMLGMLMLAVLACSCSAAANVGE